jgi:Ni,Fe-hydrogenase I small subunit
MVECTSKLNTITIKACGDTYTACTTKEKSMVMSDPKLRDAIRELIIELSWYNALVTWDEVAVERIDSIMDEARYEIHAHVERIRNANRD